MNQEDIIRMAQEAGFGPTTWQLSFGYEACGTHEAFERFAALVAAAEREECAKEIDKWIGCDLLAAAIRARGQS